MAQNKPAIAPPQQSPYPFNFSRLSEGAHDPVLDKDVKWLIDSDDDYIVYIDEQNYVEWTMNSNDRIPPEAGPILTRVGWLESVDAEGLEENQLETYKRLIGEGVARLFDGNVAAAGDAMNAAETWITSRAAEASRLWLLEGSSVALAVATLAYAVTAWRTGLDPLVHGSFVSVTGALFGALGAWFSILQRSGSENLDLGAGRRVRRVEGLSRVLTGVVGGFFVSLLMSAGYLLSAEITAKRPFFFAVCIVAGLSERLVNSLVDNVEGAAKLKLPIPGASPTNADSAGTTTPQPQTGTKATSTTSSNVLNPLVPGWGAPIAPPPL